jgi:multiple sugar transport system substrate-binding protein
MGDLLPQLRAEATAAGGLYSWPFLLDVTVQGWNGELVERAGLDPDEAPSTWDELVGNGRTIVKSGAAPFGCTFDARGWRSLVPITHSLAPDTYTEDGLFDFTHPATVEALEVMKRMVEISHPQVLDPEATLASINPDEAAFAAQTVAYFVKYQNAHVRFASGWADPERLRLAALPAGDGAGGSVFWATGIALLRYGTHKQEAAAYSQRLTHDDLLWRRSLGNGREAAGQPGAFRSLPGWSRPDPPWLAPWVAEVTAALRSATTIRPHPLGERQFTVARPYWEEYLRGSTSSPRRALARAMAAARAEARKS